jgi:N-dimethylarginine dimethylaminohydrolase
LDGERGYEILRLPESLYFEGEGDALFAGDALFCGYKFRSDINRIVRLPKCLAVSSFRSSWWIRAFYHLDTCFCPLPDGSAVWFPAAFDEYGQRAIRAHVPELIDVEEEEAKCFSCNAVVLERDIVLPEGAPNLVKTLTARGYRCHELPMSEFLKGRLAPANVSPCFCRKRKNVKLKIARAFVLIPSRFW